MNKIIIYISAIICFVLFIIKKFFSFKKNIQNEITDAQKEAFIDKVYEINKDEQIRRINGIDDVNKRLHKDAVD